ncbi:MAG: hypothetical protein ACK4N5_15675, partial [Myxococcales bacterium]
MRLFPSLLAASLLFLSALAHAQSTVDLTPPTGSQADAASYWLTRAYRMSFSTTTPITGVEAMVNMAPADRMRAMIWNSSTGQLLAAGEWVNGLGSLQFQRSAVSFTPVAGVQYTIGFALSNGNTVFRHKLNATLPFTVGDVTVHSNWSGSESDNVVHPYNSNVWYQYLRIVRGSIADTTPPSVPGTPTISPNPSAGGSVTVSWTASTDAGGSGLAGYELQVSTNDGGSWANLAAPTTNSHVYAPGQGRYLYRVRAVDGAGNFSAYSASSAALVVDTTPPTVPGTPSVSPNPSAGGNVTVSWNASTDAGGAGLASYELQVSTNDGASWATLSSRTTASHLYAPAQGRYTYRVRARDAAGNLSGFSGNSFALVVDTTAPTVPGRPT